MSRDYHADFNALLAKFTAEDQGVFSAPDDALKFDARAVAERLAKHLREGDPDLLHGWLDLHAAEYIYQLISRRPRSTGTQVVP
jgi:hypothetical protein